MPVQGQEPSHRLTLKSKSAKPCLQRPELIPLFEVPNAKAELPKLWPIVSVYIYHAKAFTQSTTLCVSSFEDNITVHT